MDDVHNFRCGERGAKEEEPGHDDDAAGVEELVCNSYLRNNSFRRSSNRCSTVRSTGCTHRLSFVEGNSGMSLPRPP